MKMKYLLKLISLLLSRGNYLTYLANIFHSDKGTLWPNRHNYTKHYHSLFKKIRHNKNLKFLEIGLCRGLDEGWEQNDVPSVKMWLKYFPYAKIYGYDYSDFSFFNHKRASIFQGDQGKKEDLNNFINISGGKFDVIIDDASHASHHQQISLGALFPHLNSGGYYIIEDLDWQPNELEKKESILTEKLFLSYLGNNSFDSPFLTKDDNKYINQNIDYCNMFNKQDQLFKLVIIKKK